MKIAGWSSLEDRVPAYALTGDRLSRHAGVPHQQLPRACGHTHLRRLALDDLSTWNRDMAALTGIAYAGVGAS
jgi:hypothetical protein